MKPTDPESVLYRHCLVRACVQVHRKIKRETKRITLSLQCNVKFYGYIEKLDKK